MRLAVEQSNAYVAYEFVDRLGVSVLALDADAHEWPAVRRLVEAVGALKLAAEMSPEMPAREIAAYGEVRDALDCLWLEIGALVALRGSGDGLDGGFAGP
jgi:hypothetical protein